MVISPKKVLELNTKYHFIEGLAERELNPEGLGIDIRVGEVYLLRGGGFLGVDHRKTSDVECCEFKQGRQRNSAQAQWLCSY